VQYFGEQSRGQCPIANESQVLFSIRLVPMDMLVLDFAGKQLMTCDLRENQLTERCWKIGKWRLF
jgi:hypothetical protein